jgi:hypothetical protein
MKKILFSVALILMATYTYAGIMGVLVSSRPVITVTGQQAWSCTYNVAGHNTTIILKQMCPVSMEFE